MKKVILGALIVWLSSAAEAQTVKVATGTQHPAASSRSGATKKAPAKRSSNASPVTSGTTGATAAPLPISDPTVKALNDRANGNNVPISPSGVAGMPKNAYGVNKGKVIFRSTDAPTSGTATGSGATGTGTAPGASGTSGQVMGVNGKSPYAGPAINGSPVSAGPADAIPKKGATTPPASSKKGNNE